MTRSEFTHGRLTKSRLVARGFKQREGIDFGETFALTVSSPSVCLLRAIAMVLDLNLCYFDAHLEFVQSHLDEDGFLRVLRRCGNLSGNVVRLNKTLNCLKQASHVHLIVCLEKRGFAQCTSNVCVFRLIENGRVAHVDDIFAVG